MQTRWTKGVAAAGTAPGVLLTLTAAAADVYTWNLGGNGNWNVPGNWSPGTAYPGQNDPADQSVFTGAVGRTVTLNVNVTNRSFTALGGGTWTWSGGSTLTIGSDNLNYNVTNTLSGRSAFTAVLAGSGGVRVNAGALRINNAANTYSGGVEVNGGILLNGPANPWDAASAYDLGVGGVIIGSGTPGSNDAALLVGGGSTADHWVTNAITIRAGNDGVARLGTWHSGAPWTYAYLKGSVTLGKNLTLVNHEERNWINNSWDAFIREYFPLYVDGGIGGSGNLSKEGLGVIQLRGTNTCTGTTTIRGGTTYIYGTNNSNVGDFTVEYGTLIVATNLSLGATGNTLTLGGNGTFGGFGITGPGLYPLVPVNRPITLAGNGGILSARGFNARPQLDGTISGSGRLILAPASVYNLRAHIHGNNTYSGGTIAINGAVDIADAAASNNTVYGSGDIWLLRDGYLYVRGGNNIAATAKVRVDWPAVIAVPNLQYVPNLTTNSDGILAFGGASSAAIHDRLGDGNNPVGNGRVWLGVAYWYTFTYGGWSLAALVANDPTHTYRIGYGQGNYIELNATNTTTQGALRDLNGTPHHVVIAEDVRLYDHNPFTGSLTVEPGAICSAYLPDASGNPLGSDTGAVLLRGNSALWVINSYSATRSVSKGALTFDGGVGPIKIDGNAGTPTWTTTFAVASLNRTGRSTLSIDAHRKTLGDVERMTVTGGIPSNNGMVAPYFWNSVDAVFLDYGAAGFTNAAWDNTTLATANATQKVNLAGAEALPAGGASVYALKSAYAITANGAAVLTNHGGGLILAGNGVTHTAPLDFGTNEAVLLVTQANTLSGPLTGSGGLTKSAAGELALRANNVGTLTGGITVNEGTLSFTNWVHLGGVVNTITLNGGTLSAPNFDAATITNDIVLGNLGGTLLGGRYRGNISGGGMLTLKDYRTFIEGPNNTYTGGTLVPGYGSGNQLYIAANSSLGPSGTVTVWNAGTDWGNSRAGLILNGDGNLTAAHRLILNSFNSYAMFKSANPVVGSIEGNGTISFGTDAIAATLRVGGNNLSTDFFGLLSDADYFSVARTGLDLGTLVKEGTGTLTLWGECWYRGGTIISNGTLCVNNWMHPSNVIVVKPNGTLDGIGSVGIVSNQGGTVRGNLYIRSLNLDSASTFAVTLGGTNVVTDFAQLHVTEGVKLNSDGGAGSTLVLTLHYAPQVGQTFKILDNASAGAVSGQFSTGRIVSATYGGRTYYFSVNTAGGDGNDIELTALPVGTVISIR